jgi:hypothetical protein
MCGRGHARLQLIRKSLGAHAKSFGVNLRFRPAGFAVLAVTMNACGAAQVAPEPTCRAVLAPGTPPRPAQLAGLAGRYDLALISNVGEPSDSLVQGVLVLWANDSARRYMPPTIGRRPGERPLAGSFESQSTTIPSVPNGYEPGTAEDPAVEMVGATIYLGGLEYSDAGGHQLTVQEINSGGFRGAWSYDPGFSRTVDAATGRELRDPGGYFCAVRAARP